MSLDGKRIDWEDNGWSGTTYVIKEYKKHLRVNSNPNSSLKDCGYMDKNCIVRVH